MNKDEALKLALEYANAKATWYVESLYGTSKSYTAEKEREMQLAEKAIREALADSALDRMAENARELGLDYEPAQKDYKAFYDGKKWYSVEVEPPCKTGSQCTSKCQQCDEPAQQQEPHGWYIDGYGAVLGASEPKSVRPGEWLPFYTSPQPAQPSKPLTDELNQIAEDLRFHGLTLVKTVTGYAVLKLGHVAAHAKGDA